MVDVPVPMASVVELPSTPDTLLVAVEVGRFTPEALFAYWIRPELLRQWWPQEAEIDARVGGAYHLAWPAMEWHLRGRYIAVEPGKRLAFTWHWDHDPAEMPERRVEVGFEPLGAGGTKLTIRHGSYTDSPRDDEERAGHLEGWTYFLGRLQMLPPE